MVHAITSEFLVNDKTEFAQHDSAITPFVEGGFAIGWVDVQSDPETPHLGDVILPVSDQIRGRAFDPTGQPVASSLVLSGEGQPRNTYFSDLDGIVLMNGDVAFGWRTQWTDVYEEQTRTFSPGWSRQATSTGRNSAERQRLAADSISPRPRGPTTSSVT